MISAAVALNGEQLPQGSAVVPDPGNLRDAHAGFDIIIIGNDVVRSFRERLPALFYGDRGLNRTARVRKPGLRKRQ